MTMKGNKRLLLTMLLAVLLFALAGISHAATETITYTYDNTRQLRQADYVQGQSIAYTYDAMGNRLTMIVTGDTLPPDTTITNIIPSGTITNQTGISFSFAASETAAFECSIDSIEFAVCTSPQVYSSLADGEHTFSVRATDTAGNIDTTPAIHAWTTDTTRPLLSIIAPRNHDNIIGNSTSISGIAVDIGAGLSLVEISIDGGAWTAASGTTSWTYEWNDIAVGPHTIQGRASDRAGNIGPAPHTIAVTAVQSYALSVSKSGIGTITSSPSGIDCGATCSRQFGENQSVTLTATPDTGYVFEGWSGACSGRDICVVTMTEAKSVTARFVSDTAVIWTDEAGVRTACVSSANSLINALVDAEFDGQPNRIKVVQGTYLGLFAYAGENQDLEIVGGYDAGCSTRTINPALTILDGDIDNNTTADGVVLDLMVLNAGAGSIIVDGFTARNGINTVDEGGCIRIFTDSGQITVKGNVVTGCSAVDAGGIGASTSSGKILLANNIIFNNSAISAAGAGAFTTSGQIVVLNNTITDNMAADPGAGGGGGGLGISLESNSATAEIANNIIWGNVLAAGNGCNDVVIDSDAEEDGTHAGVQFRYNGTTGAGAVCSTDPSFVLGAGNIMSNPLFVNAAADDYRIQDTSPCKDTGLNNHADQSEFDFEGQVRVQMSAIDMGADEIQLDPPSEPVITPTSPVVVTNLPTFTWSEVTNAAQYQLKVTDSNGQVVREETIESSSICANGTCTVSSTVPLTAEAAYTWTVRAINTAGSSDWTPPRSFYVTLIAPSAKPTQISPQGLQNTIPPVYTWTEVPGATNYILYVTTTGSVVVQNVTFDASSICSAGICSAPTAGLQMENEYWWNVRGFNSFGYGPWSGAWKITLTESTIPPPPVQIAPTGLIATSTPLYQWNAVTGATSYRLVIYDVTTGFDKLYDAWHESSALGCSGDICQLVSPITLQDGYYRWNLRAKNLAGTGDSASMNYTVSVTPVTEAPVLIAPTGTIVTITPVYQWSTVPAADQYRLRIYNTTTGFTLVHDATYTEDALGCQGGGTCGIAPSGLTLSSGTSYRWYVNGKNRGSTGPSLDTAFTTFANVTSPNGGETLTGLNTHTVTWNPYSGATTYTLSYSTAGAGGPWTQFATGVVGTSYIWTVPNTATTTGRIRVSAYNGTTWLYQDFSDGDFTIQTPAGNVLSPNGGETLTGLYSYTITWNVYPPATSYSVAYSTTGSGGPWTTLTTTATGTSYEWTVPNVATTTARVRVMAYIGTAWQYTDLSDSDFTIQTPAGNVLGPNGGETLTGLYNQAITWNVYPPATSYTLSYSTTGVGGPWMTIATGVTGTSYNWTVPNTATTTGRIRVSAYNGTTWLYQDFSDSDFTIQTPAGKVLSPNGGETLTGLYNQAITWNEYPPATSYTLSYSTAGAGGPWMTIATGVAGTSYNWTVPNTATTTGRVRVSAYNGTTWLYQDFSDSDFLIQSSATTPAYMYAPSTSTDGTIGLGWGATSTAGATYVVEESTDAGFVTVMQVYSGPDRAVTLTGRANATYYYRVKAIKAGAIDSAWAVGPNGCVVAVVVATPAYMYVPAAPSGDLISLGWGATSTAGATYVVEESTDAGFVTVMQVYSGPDRAVTLTGRANATYYYRVKAIKAGATDSAWAVGPNGCVVAVVVATPAYMYVPSTSTDGTIGLGWGATSTAGATYVVEESTDAGFATVTQVYSGPDRAVTLTGRANATYYYRVKAIKAGANDSAWAVGPNGCSVSHPVTSVDLVTDKTSPQVISTAITWTGTGQGGSGNYEYKFWLKGPSTGNVYQTVRDYNTSSSWTWMPSQTGYYSVQVWARNVGSTANYEAYATVISYGIAGSTPATDATLTSEKSSPQNLTTVGSVTFTAGGIGGTGNYEYQYWLKDPVTGWGMVRDYSAVATWAWTPSAQGTYYIQVQVRNAGSPLNYEAARTIGYVIDNPVTSVDLVPGYESPESVNMWLTFTAAGHGGTGNYEYQFWVKPEGGQWAMMRDYSASASWIWTPTSAGTYYVMVYVRNVGSTAAYEASQSIGYVINYPVTSVDLEPDRASPQVANASITWTATGHQGTGTCEYRFWLLDPVYGWIVVREYSTTGTWVWTPSQPGTYSIQVHARNVGTSRSYDSYKVVSYVIQ